MSAVIDGTQTLMFKSSKMVIHQSRMLDLKQALESQMA